jgi:Cu+-exporting ATPase
VVTNANRLRAFQVAPLPEKSMLGGDVPVSVEIGATSSKEEEEMAMVRDPVCGMDIDAATAAASEEYEDATYYFCSLGCQERFKADPEKYALARR